MNIPWGEILEFSRGILNSTLGKNFPPWGEIPPRSMKLSTFSVQNSSLGFL